jgi:hypothetical protein
MQHLFWRFVIAREESAVVPLLHRPDIFCLRCGTLDCCRPRLDKFAHPPVARFQRGIPFAVGSPEFRRVLAAFGTDLFSAFVCRG